jgi:DNA-binding NarL/FixJ family response regulator
VRRGDERWRRNGSIYAALLSRGDRRGRGGQARGGVAADAGAVPELADGHAIDLTARERQLVELARQGLPNAEIAERLVLSVRTVESHLYRAMQKLGVSDRREL